MKNFPLKFLAFTFIAFTLTSFAFSFTHHVYADDPPCTKDFRDGARPCTAEEQAEWDKSHSQPAETQTPLSKAQSYTPLAPIPGVNVAEGDAGTKCLSESTDAQVSDSNCKTDVTTFIPAAVRFVIMIAGALAVVMLVIGGVQYASSDAIGGKSAGKERITNAIWGLVLAIAAFVVLQTVNPNTLKLNLSLGTTAPTNINGGSTGVFCDTGEVAEGNKCVPAASNELGKGADWPPDTIIASQRDDNIRQTLAILNKSTTPIRANQDCKKVGDTECTSLDGLTEKTTAGLLHLANDARGTGAIITVTGGTEYWMHCVDANGKPFDPPCDDPSTTTTDHKSGSALDISSNDAKLNTVITKLGTATASSGNGCESSSLGVYTLDGGIYVKEKDTQSSSGYHWHVCYK